MALSLNGSSNTIGGLAVGGLPDGIVDTDMLAANAVNKAKLATNEQQGLAKAWVVFNGSDTGSILDSFNVSSITDNGTGDYNINFSTALSNANYAFIGSIHNADNSGNQASGAVRGPAGVHGEYQSTGTTSTYRIEVRYGAKNNSDGGVMDASRIYCVFFGD